MEWGPLPANAALTQPLAALLRWWIRQQVTQAVEVQVYLGDMTSLWRSGRLPLIQVSAHNVIYRQVHLQQVVLQAQNIQFHWPFFRQYKEPFIEPIAVAITATITEQNVNQSLSVLQDFLQPYLQELTGQRSRIQELHIREQYIDWCLANGHTYRTQVTLVSPWELELQTLAPEPKTTRISLGSDGQIDKLNIETGTIYLSGQLVIRPAGAPAESQSNRPGEP
ncbi:MAG: LmeA family phospholipid-binding protein [Gloeomargarita sp. HHBFW_bins_205]